MRISDWSSDVCSSDLTTTFTETPGSLKREKRPTLLIHPAAAADLGIADGQRVRLGNRQGSLVIRAAFFDGLQPDVVVVESIWPNRAFEEGRGINLLTSADPGRPAGGRSEERRGGNGCVRTCRSRWSPFP